MLVVHRSSRGDLLVEGLAGVLAEPPDDPFVREIVSVPTRGIERWLSQQLSLALGTSASGSAPGGGSAPPERDDGVCANIDFPFPASLIGTALAATGLEPDHDPWSPDVAVWPLLEAVEACLDEKWMSTLAAHLGHRPGGSDPFDEARRARRFSTVRHLADLYDRYGLHRPALLRSWAAGDDVDASGRPLPTDLAWQAPLWRQLRTRIGVPSPSERLIPACAALRERPELADLPSRLSVFGLTRLSASYLAVLDAIAARREVHLWLLHPSAAQWSRAAARLGPHPVLGSRLHDIEVDRAGHPLLVTWGRDAREMQAVLTASVAGQTITDLPPSFDVIPIPGHPDTVLGRLQAAIREDRPPPASTPMATGTEDGRPLLDPDDHSLQIHSCHGRTRQVEVLRNVILGLLADDPTLEPRDIVVMCPDIDTFAPLIQATFGPGREVAGRDLHVRLADRSLRQTNQVLTAVTQLLDMAAGRLTASAVIDFAGSAPVRRRFRFDDDDLSRVEQWVRTSGIRWGLDEADRAPFHLGSIGAGTWRTGLDRILLGVAMSEEDLRLFGGVLPVDDVGGSEIDRVGRLAELLDRIASTVESFACPHPLDTWLKLIADAADDLTLTSRADQWQRTELQVLLAETSRAAIAGGQVGRESGPGDLSLTEIRSLLAHRLRGRPTRANFRTGHLTMCTLVPMRSVPHRVVCLLGLDDGVFPRHPSRDGDDLLERDPWVGDRDARSEDRQLLLDALLAAREHLVITFAGRNDRTNAQRPPSVPVGELLDVIDASVRTAEGVAARTAVLIEHPLQSWDARNFTPGALGVRGPASFDQVALEGARAAAGERVPAVGLRGMVSGVDLRDPVELDDLVRFVQHPIRSFLRQTLGVRTPDEATVPADGLPIALDALQRWQIGERLLVARLGGAGRSACRAAELARGELPPGRLGEPVLDQLLRDVDVVLAAAARSGPGLATLDLTVDLGGRSVVGTVSDIDGDELSTVTYSRLAPRHRLTAWVRLLAVSAACPERPWRARSIGRGDRRSVAIRTLGPLEGDPDRRRRLALGHLQDLVDLYDRGRLEPLPLFCRTSEAWAGAARRGQSRHDSARGTWVTAPGAKVPGEDDDPAHLLVFGKRLPFEELLSAVPGPDEQGDGWVEGETSRLGRLARRLWDPLLSQEESRRQELGEGEPR